MRTLWLVATTKKDGRRDKPVVRNASTMSDHVARCVLYGPTWLSP
jgi:hypothetical protein